MRREQGSYRGALWSYLVVGIENNKDKNVVCPCLIKAQAQSQHEQYSSVVKTSDSSEAEQFTANQPGLR